MVVYVEEVLCVDDGVVVVEGKDNVEEGEGCWEELLGMGVGLFEVDDFVVGVVGEVGGEFEEDGEGGDGGEEVEGLVDYV